MSATVADRLHEELHDIWRAPPGIGQLSAVNHTAVGTRYIATGFAFFAVGGLLLYSSFVFDAVPDGGWFMYVPLNSKPCSAGINADL